MKTLQIAILGGSGFVGQHLLPILHSQGHGLRVLSRRPERHRELKLLPGLELWPVDVHDEAALTDSLCDCQVALNLVGILNESGHAGQGFRRVHVDLPAKLARACLGAQVGRVLHLSAAGADARQGASLYLRTKGEGEQQLRVNGADRLAITIFRPSVIFGPGDQFLNRFARLLHWAPGIFPLPCAQARMQPVFVGDVGLALAAALKQPETIGQRYCLGGPRIYTLLELARLTAEVAGIKRLVLPAPDPLARLQAAILEYFPGKPFSRDNYRSAQVANVCETNALETVFGLAPRSVEAQLPLYLGHPKSWAERRRLI
ncbi:MAG: complex I NDUFA9 subunit family protein [Pseudomonadota bacterium]